VTGSRQGTQRESAEVDFVPLAKSAVAEGPVPCNGAEDLGGVIGGQLDRAGEEVRVQVGLGGERHREAVLVGRVVK
jgi:hypothetical protein